MGDIIGDISSRRGRIEGSDTKRYCCCQRICWASKCSVMRQT
ncbi:MAG: hypothetical protein ACLRWH_03910 [Emergencia sp.]